MCKHCEMVERQRQRVHDAQNSGNYAAYDEGQQRIKADMQRIVDKTDAMAFDGRIEYEKEHDLYSAYLLYPGGNRRFYSEADFDEWFRDWCNRNHSRGGGTVRIFEEGTK